MSEIIKLKKGLNIRLKGVAEKILSPEIPVTRYGVKPIDFPGLVPKVTVKPDDNVKAGSVLFTDKQRPEIKITSPVSGKVVDIVRGERRRLLEVVIEVSGNDYEDFGKADPATLTGEQVKEKMLASGLWPVVRQRPYHMIARPDAEPKSIFISGFDTAPLAPDYDFVMHNSDLKEFSTGIQALRKLTKGKVNLVLDGSNVTGSVLKATPDVDIHYVKGPHPAGNVGVQIHHIDPVNKGEVVWYVNLQDVSAIGRLFNEGHYRHDRIIALTGSDVLRPSYHRVRSGASISGITKGNINPVEVRFISGNVLTGTSIAADGFLGYYDNMVTVIPEGRYHEFFGWMTMGFDKFSSSRTYASSIIPRKEYVMNTNIHGGERAFVLTGVYEKVLPMDILPMHLLKAILVDDIEMMEKLGIYEVAEEDFALCEYVCPSKIEIQSIIRKGLDLMVKEMS
ncbi:MAG: Na(+)-translocating NADH-quinone reductase subunit A [Bacteroidales bacterium]|nr:Na(+)-translocating NADH-quinone reductase subunit A [Bacteroidales bacterium]